MLFRPKTEGNQIVVYLDPEMDLPERDAIEPYLSFHCTTYKKISNDGEKPEVWGAIFSATNWMLHQLTDEQRKQVLMCFCNINAAIKHDMPKDQGPLAVAEFVKQLGERYLRLVDDLGLIEKFDTYSRMYIKMGDTSKFGKRPQDTAELTFVEEEMRALIVVAFLCKMMAPVFGELMANIPSVLTIEDGKKKTERDREMKCVVLMNPIIEAHFKTLIDKFQHYLRHTVNGCCSTDKPAAVFSGYTPSTRSYIIFANLLVRNFINVNLLQDDSNIMRFSDSIARTLVGTQDSNSNRKQVKTRVAYGATTGDEGGNIAQMEIDSLVSLKTMDVPIIVAASIRGVIDKYMLRYDISWKEFQECLDYFAKNPIHPSSINRFVTCGFFGRDIGGGRGILTLDSTHYTQLVCLLQMIVFTYGYKQFGHILTAAPTTNVKVMQSEADSLFMLNYGTSFSYHNCKAKFEGGAISSNGREWDTQMQSIVSDLTKQYYVYNTPDYIWDLMNEDDTNGKTIEVTSEITGQMCAFIENALSYE